MRVVWMVWLVMQMLLQPAHADRLETPRFRQLTVADGLPSNMVLDLAEDRDGYLWVATLDGLARYDGVGFRVWRKEDGLVDNEISAVAVDARNRIWIGQNSGGVAYLDADRRLHMLNDLPGSLPIKASVWSLAATGDGSLWIGTMDAGLYRMAADGRWTHFLHRDGDARSLPGNRIPRMLVDDSGTLWISTDTALARWTGNHFQRVPAEVHDGQPIERFIVDRAGNAWVSTFNFTSVYRRDGSWTRHSRLVSSSRHFYQVLLQERSGRYWFDDQAGVASFADNHVLHVTVRDSATGRTLIPQWNVGAQDREGGIWLASLDSGLWYLPAQWNRFSVFMREKGRTGTLSSDYIGTHTVARAGHVWVAGNAGQVDLLDLASGAVRQRVAYNTIDPDAGVATSLATGPDGVLWIGANASLIRHDSRAARSRVWRASADADAMLDEVVHAMQHDARGRLWVMGQASGLQWRDAEGRVLRTLRGEQRSGLPADVDLHAMRAGPDGTMWISGTSGLYRWNESADRFERVPGSHAGVTRDFVGDLHGSRVWTSHPDGIRAFRWDGRRLQATGVIGPRDGLPLIDHTGLLLDEDDVLWASSMRGLQRIDIRSKQVRLYGMADGWPGQDILQRPQRLPDAGPLVFNTSNAVIALDPARLQPLADPSPLVVESVSVSRPQGRLDLPLAGGFRLGPDARDLRVVARVLSFRNAREHAYRFRLEGHDADWVDGGSSGERVYSQLTPGDWTLQLMGRNADNVWSAPVSIRFSVDPPWWRTGWALSAFGVLALALLALMALEYRARVRRQHAHALSEQRRELAEQASQAKTRFLANLGHEVRTPLTGVLGMSELLLGTSLQTRQRGYAESIHRAGEHLLRLVNDALDLARVEAGRLELDARDFNLRGLIREVVDLMAPLAERGGLQFSDAIDAAVPATLHGDRTRVEQILLNLLGNAIKFTDSGHVSLEVLPLQPQGVRLLVGDSGPGMTAEQQERLFRRFEQAEGAKTSARYGGSGLGLAISQELALAMGGGITVHSTLGEGTVFTVDLPLPSGTTVRDYADAASPVERSTILLVEDDPIVADVIIALLRRQGHAVVHATHALEALTLLSQHAFDLALLDLDLPGIDGIALAAQLRAMGFDRPLVALTARADGDAEMDTKAAGFDGFLRKPVTGAILAQGIARVLAPADPI